MKRISSFIIALAVVFLFSPDVSASSGSWLDTGITGASWINNDNWVLDVAPGATSGTTNTDVATFNSAVGPNTFGSSTTPITIDPDRNLGGISFDTTAGNYNIGTTSGNSLLLTSGGTIQVLGTLSATDAAETINAPLVIEGADGTYTFSNNSANGTGVGAGTLNFGGAITGGAAGATVLTLSGSNTNSNTISGDIANGSATSLAIVKSGAGTWTLSGDNSYSGGTTLSAGTLNINGTTALGSTASALTINGGTVNNTSGALITIANSNPITFGGNFAYGTAAGTAANDLDLGSGAVTNGGNYTITLNGAGALSFDGVMTNTAGAANTLTVNNGTGTTSATAVNFGGYALSNNATDYIDVINGSGNVNITGAVTNGGTSTVSGLTYSGTGTLALSGTNTYGGLTTMNNSSGTLVLSGDNSGAAGGVTLTAGTLDINSPKALGTGTLFINGGTTIDNTHGSAVTLTTNNAQTWNGSFTFTGTNSLNLGTGAVTLDATPVVTVGNNTLTVGGPIGGGFGLTKAGAGTLVLSGDNAYTDTTTLTAGTLRATTNATALGTGALAISGGTLQLANDTSLDFGNDTTITGNTTIQSDRLTSGAGVTQTLGNLSIGADTLNVTAGSNVASGTAGLTFGSTTLTADGATFTANTGTLLTLGDVSGSGDSFTVNGAGNTDITGIIGTVGGSVTKSGTGTLTLSGVNTFTGGVNFNGGIVNATSLSNLGNSAPLNFNGGTLQFGGNFDPSVDTMTFNAGGASFDTDGQTITFADAVGNAGAGGLTKIGTGSLTLNGSNSYAGATTVNEGALIIAAGSGLGSTTAPLSVNNFDALGAGTTAELENSSGSAMTTGSLSGSITNPGSGGTANQVIIDNGGSAFTVNQTSSGTYQGIIQGAGAFNLGASSTAALTLSGDNTYSGGTTISAGTLRVGNANALGTGSVTNNAALDLGSTSLALGPSAVYTQNTGSTLDLTISSASVFGNITADSASLSGANIYNVSVGYAIPVGTTTFSIINTTGGVGTPSYAPTFNDSAVLSYSTAVLGNDLILTVDNVGYASSATNANALAVANTLNNISNPSSDMSAVKVILNGLNAAQLSSALNSMVPVVDAGIRQNSTASLNNFISASLERVQNMMTRDERITEALNRAQQAFYPSPALVPDDYSGFSSGDEPVVNGIWAKPFSSYLKQGTLQGIQGYDAWNAGTVVGYDQMLTDNFTLGASGGYAYGQVNSDVENAATDVTSAQGSIYTGYQGIEHPYFIDAAGTFAWNWYKGTRDISLGNLNRRAVADYQGQQYSTYLGGGYKFKLPYSLALTPTASLQWTRLVLGSYTETGAGALGLNVRSQTYDTVETALGAGLSTQQTHSWGVFTPEIHAKWLYDFVDDPMTMVSSFSGGGGSFTSNGAKPSKNGLDIGGKLTWDLISDVSFIAQCDAELRDGYIGIYGSGTVRYKF